MLPTRNPPKFWLSGGFGGVSQHIVQCPLVHAQVRELFGPRQSHTLHIISALTSLTLKKTPTPIQWVGVFCRSSIHLRRDLFQNDRSYWPLKKYLCHNISHVTDGITGAERVLDMTSHTYLKGQRQVKINCPACLFSDTRQGKESGSVKLLTSVKVMWFFQIRIIFFPILLGMKRDTVSKSR